MTTTLLLIQRYWLAITLLLLVTITTLSLRPLATLPVVPGNDKVHHFIAYAALMFPAAVRKPRYLLLIGVFFIAWSGAIELLQPYMHRYAEWLDLAANTGGVIAGVLASILARTIVNKI